jgi:CelD/BcsL family acetyltransferase involved in cellulose biosynthesis
VIEVRALTPADEAAYTAFLAGRLDALLYHSLPYRDLLLDHLDAEADYLLALEGGEVRGILPAMWRDGILNALPFFGSHGAPVAATDAAREALLAAWDERAAEARAATLVENPFGARHRAPSHDATDERLNQAVPGHSRAEPSAARNVRKAHRLGVTVAREPDALPQLAALHAENMQAIGAPAKEPAFFAAISRHFAADAYDVYTARLGGRLAAALLVFWAGAAAEYFTPAIAPELRTAQPLAAILAAAIPAAAARGHAWFNFGGTGPTNSGLRRFKRKWGARTVTYRSFTKINDRTLLDATPDELRARFGGFYVVPYGWLTCRA